MSEAIEEWLEPNEQHRLAIIASLEVEHLIGHAAALEHGDSMRVVQVGRNLTEVLLAVETGRRAIAAEQRVLQHCRAAQGAPVVFARVDLLFHPQLDGRGASRLDPLVLFQRVSRVTPVLVMWPGSFDGTTLKYAVPEHRHYRHWTSPSAYIIDANR